MTHHTTTLDAWTDTCQRLFKHKKAESTVHPIHTCVINGERHYIHAPKLSREDPTFFQQLRAFAQKHNIRLQADRRQTSDDAGNERRKKLLPIIFLALGVNGQCAFAGDGTLADDGINHDQHTHSNHSTSLFMYKAPTAGYKTTSEHAIVEKKVPVTTSVNKVVHTLVENILQRHFVSQDDDPENISEELTDLATYYANHPEAVTLLENLSYKDWELKYAPYTFQTDIQGSRLNVDRITVYFDPRSGAKLKFYDKCETKKPFCVASPADALLHELLHVQSVVHDTPTFIAQGGLGQHMYPAEHERHTILKENILYKSMSRRDNKPRPIRSEHTGRHILVSCVTCIE